MLETKVNAVRSALTCLSAAALSALLAACTTVSPPHDAIDVPAQVQSAPWPAAQDGLPPFEKVLTDSDLAADPDYRIGRLPNGLSYVIRHNDRPEGTALVRLRFDTGSLDETEAEQGYAHFVEHMAFNGSTRVPEGEMVPLLERKGLAFGADTNASTGFDATTYKLDLPTNEPDLLDTALMLMRETASELLFDPQAVEREKGVVLSEMRDRNTYGFAELVDRFRFQSPHATYPWRLPIGTEETVGGATAEGLRAFWARNYRPGHAVLTVIGDYDPALVESKIRKHFAGWKAKTATVPQRDYGTIDPDRAPATDIYVHPALAESVTATRNGPPQLRPDTAESRREKLLRYIGYAIVNRRFRRIARQEDAPFKSAGFSTGEIFRFGRQTQLTINTAEGAWQTGIAAAVAEYRRALAGGFSQAEVDEQLSDITTAIEDAAAAEATRTNGELTQEALALFEEGEVPTTPGTVLARYRQIKDTLTPENVFAAMKAEALALNEPMLRYVGRSEPNGGGEAVRAAWNAAMAAPLTDIAPPAVATFAYTEFGAPGTVVKDTRDPVFGIREVTFANNVRLNVKRTDLTEDQVLVRVSIDGGALLATPDDPLAVELVPSLPAGGLGKHSADELDTILAGRRAGLSLSASGDSFVSTRTTTPRDFELQLDLVTALITDPGYRPDALFRYRQQLPDRFARMEATPRAALGSHQNEVLSDGDPRYTIAPIEAYEALDFAQLRADIGKDLSQGAIEIGVVGAIDEDEAIAMVAKTLGALPRREASFEDRAEARQRSFTERRGPVILRHEGEANQALIRYVYPTTDDSDPNLTARLEMLERVAQLRLTDELREKLGKAYSPGVASAMSRTYPGYGLFILDVGVDLSQLGASNAAIEQTVASLRETTPSADLMLRARQPLLDRYDNALKSNEGWLGLVGRAQSEANRLERFATFRQRIETITAEQLQQAAQRWLPPGGAVEFFVIPDSAPDQQIEEEVK